MAFATKLVTLDNIRPWREQYQREMSCQIIHDSIHARAGWTKEYAILIGDTVVGYGSVAVAGPWRDRPTVYEFYLAPDARTQQFPLFRALLLASGAVGVAGQSNDPHIVEVLRQSTRALAVEKILFADAQRTRLAPPGATFRSATAEEATDAAPDDLRWRGVVEVAGDVVATGGVLFHYNRPYGDIYMEVAAAHRRRGYGSFIVQELKRRCYEAGHVPAARCSPDNAASARTLEKAGFVPCGELLAGIVAPDILARPSA